MISFNKIYKGYRYTKKKHKSFTFVLELSFVILVFFISLLSQMKNNVKKFWVDSFIGGNIITSNNNDFFDLFTPSSLEEVFSYSDFIGKQSSKIKFAPRLRVQCLLETSQTCPLIMNGVQIESELELGSHLLLEKGKYFSENQNEILLTKATASSLGVDLGDDICFTVMTADGYPSYELLKLVGYISVGNISAISSDNIGYMSLSTLQNLCYIDSDSVNEIVTNAKSKNKIKGSFKFVKGQNMISISKLVSTGIELLEVLVVFLFGCFIIFNILSNVKEMIKEKNKEISIYLTFGAEPLVIRAKIFIEFFIYCTHIFLVGSIISLLLIIVFNSLGFYSIDTATEMLMSTSRFTISINPVIFVFVFLLLVLLMGFGTMKTVIKKTSLVSLKSIEKDV